MTYLLSLWLSQKYLSKTKEGFGIITLYTVEVLYVQHNYFILGIITLYKVSLPYVRHNCFMYSFSVTVRSKLFIINLRITLALRYTIDQGSPCPLATLNPFGRELLLSDVSTGIKWSTWIKRSIMYMIMNMTSYDHKHKHKHEHKHDHEGHIEPKPLIFKVRIVL
jgi:hypothetical protein